MISTDEKLDQLFQALSDSTRRSILLKIRDQDHNVNEIASEFNISLPAVSKHLNILERAGLISRQKLGRQRICRVQPERLRDAYEWLEFYQKFWNDRLDQLKQLIEQDTKTPRS